MINPDTFAFTHLDIASSCDSSRTFHVAGFAGQFALGEADQIYFIADANRWNGAGCVGHTHLVFRVTSLSPLDYEPVIGRTDASSVFPDDWADGTPASQAGIRHDLYQSLLIEGDEVILVEGSSLHGLVRRFDLNADTSEWLMGTTAGLGYSAQGPAVDSRLWYPSFAVRDNDGHLIVGNASSNQLLMLIE